MKIAFAGNPNSGKTTMFNALTGRNEKVGNWAGVTVDKKEAPMKKNYAPDGPVMVVDLPGAYSMSPFSSEESVTRDYIQQEHPDVIVNVVDATNLSRSLFFTTQLLELEIPMVVALNKSDLNEKKRNSVDTKLLSEELGCPVVETVSTDSDDTGLAELAKAALERVGQTQQAPFAQGNVDQNDRKAVEAADRQRYAFVNKLVSQVERRKVRTHEINGQDKFDNVITNPWLGLPIFGLVMFLVFQISQSWVGPWIADWLVSWIDLLGSWVSDLMVNANPLLTSLLVDGMIGGFGAVVGFLPLVMVMYFLIALLEDCGYMARATVVLDPMFKKVGLSGKSMIPFIIGTGCAIPGIMAARTIPNERERNAAAMLAPFMPCGAKLPVIALFVGAFFPGYGWVGTAMYFVGIVVILLCALLVNAIAGTKGRRTFFIIELPEYKIPSFKRALQSMCSQGWAYIVKAGTIILLCNFAVHMMQSFSWNFAPVAEGADNSILATIATPFAYVLIPIVGYHAWQLAAAAVTGFIAKENVVGTLAVCYTFAINDDLEMESGNEVVDAMYRLSKVGALAYMMFNLFSPPCFAAIGAMNAEIKDKKWLFGGIALQLCVGYSLGYLVYTIGTLITDPAALHVPGAIWGGVAVAVMAGVSAILCLRTNQTCKGERICKQ